MDEAEWFEAGEYEFDSGEDPIFYEEGWYSYDDELDDWLLEEDDGAYELVITEE